MARGRAGPLAIGPLLRDQRVRSVLVQIIFCLLAAAAIAFLVHEASINLARRHLATGFGFWNVTAGFDISQTLIDYSSSTSTYGRAFWVGLLNTLLVAAIGIVLTTLLGFTIGIARLSSNWLVARLANGYVQLIRNIPLLLQLLFWDNAGLQAPPSLSATSRCCYSSCSGTTRCSRRCRIFATACACRAAAFSTIAGSSCRRRSSAGAATWGFLVSPPGSRGG